MDGLLLDTEAIFKAAWQHAARVCGYALSDETFLKFIGRSARDTDTLLVDIFGQEFVPRHFREVADQYAKDYETKRGLPVKPGVHALIAYGRRQDWPLAVASSTHAKEVERRLRASELRHEFKAVVAGDQVSQGKPEPEIYLTAAGKLGVEPEHCLALEDSHAGVKAARRAGMTVVMIPDLLPATDEMRALAAAVLESLEKVPAWLEAR